MKTRIPPALCCFCASVTTNGRLRHIVVAAALPFVACDRPTLAARSETAMPIPVETQPVDQGAEVVTKDKKSSEATDAGNNGDTAMPTSKVPTSETPTAHSTNDASNSCPTGFVPVPGDPTTGLGSVQNTQGVAPFCIAKYEMKHPADASGLDDKNRDNNAVPVSQPHNKPWTLITRNDAHAACGRMSQAGFTFSLISNGEWQAVARNMESTAANWSGGKVGEGAVPRGHSDPQPFESLAASRDDDSYFGTGNSNKNGWEQKRTHTLSNGAVVWDLAGNLWEWVYEDKSAIGVDEANFKAQDLTTLSERNGLLFRPHGNFGRNQNMGYFWTHASSAVARGGYWCSEAGLFSAYVGLYPDNAQVRFGFRCVARPSR